MEGRGKALLSEKTAVKKGVEGRLKKNEEVVSDRKEGGDLL